MSRWAMLRAWPALPLSRVTGFFNTLLVRLSLLLFPVCCVCVCGGNDKRSSNREARRTQYQAVEYTLFSSHNLHGARP